MPAQPRVSARLLWNFAYRFCSGARNSRKTGVASCVVFLSSVFLPFFAARAAAADGGPTNQANTSSADAHSTAAPSPDDTKPAVAASDDAKPGGKKKDAPRPHPK